MRLSESRCVILIVVLDGGVLTAQLCGRHRSFVRRAEIWLQLRFFLDEALLAHCSPVSRVVGVALLKSLLGKIVLDLAGTVAILAAPVAHL